MTTISNNLYEIQARIARAATAAQRTPASVTLLAVSKTFGPEAVIEAAQAGQRRFGENYIQEAIEKMAIVAQAGLTHAIEWHCIGPIQSNKTRLVAQHFDWVHTVDRLKIAERLSDQRSPEQAPLQICIQVNVDGGLNKSGIPPEEAMDLLLAMASLPRLRVRGLMAIPEPAPHFEAQCAVFKRVKALFDEVRALRAPGLAQFDTLSLGMTADLDAAVASGSTMVRVGSGIFGTRHYAAPEGAQ